MCYTGTCPFEIKTGHPDIIGECGKPRGEECHEIEMLKQESENVAYEMQRPSVLFRPTITKYGNAYMATYGDIKGIGDSANEAMRNFDEAWEENVI